MTAPASEALQGATERDWCIIACRECGEQKRHMAFGMCKICYQADRRSNPDATVRTHGYSGYSWGCRCRVCKDAKADYMRERRAAAFVNTDPGPVPGVTHGTRFAYEERGCRCDECVAAEYASSRYPERRVAS